MPEAAQVPGLSQDGERVDRPDAWDGPQAYEVRMCSKQVAGLLFDLITLGDGVTLNAGAVRGESGIA